MILIINENRSITTLLKTYLETAEIKVNTAHSYSVVMDLLNKNSFRKIISDISLPATSGNELINSIKKNCGKADIIVLTHMDQFSQKQAISRFGVDYFLTFPLDFSKLDKLING